MRTVSLVLSLAAMVLFAGCSSQPEYEGECVIKVRYDGHAYRAVRALAMPRPDRSLGSAAFGDCDGIPLKTPRKGELFALPGVDASRAVLLRSEGHDSVYVSTAVPRRNWPSLVQAAIRYPDCEGPTSFTGRMEYADRATAWEQDYELSLPYTATLTATHGKGLALGRWSWVRLEARITTRTEPVPSPRFLKRALANKNPPQVVVTTKCRGTTFIVSTIGFDE